MEIFVIVVVLSIVPAMIANNKGRSFFPWFIYGLLIFPIMNYDPSVKQVLVKNTYYLLD